MENAKKRQLVTSVDEKSGKNGKQSKPDVCVDILQTIYSGKELEKLLQIHFEGNKIVVLVVLL